MIQYKISIDKFTSQEKFKYMTKEKKTTIKSDKKKSVPNRELKNNRLYNFLS